MAKIQAPAKKAPEAPETKAPAVDMSPLFTALQTSLTKVKEGKEQETEGKIETIVEIRDFIATNGGKESVERDAIYTTIAGVVAELFELKVEQVTKKPDESLKKSKPEDYARRSYAYQLSREMLGMAWAKDDKCDAKVAKLIEGGEKRWTVLKKASQKSQSNPARDPDAGKITAENFAEQFNLFLTKAIGDSGLTADNIYDRAEKVIEANRNAPQ